MIECCEPATKIRTNLPCPVRAGETVVARATIKDIDRARRRCILTTVCSVGDTVVVDGEATILVPNRPDADA